MDVFEHAFMVDYGLKRADYIARFSGTWNWKAAEARSDAPAARGSRRGKHRRAIAGNSAQ